MSAWRTAPHTVYEIWSGDTCLYVGMTRNTRRRLNEHRQRQPWWPSVTDVKYTDCPDWRAASFLERVTIVQLCPTHNLRDNPERNPGYWLGRLPLHEWRAPEMALATADPSP